METLLLQTKLYIPPPRPELVPRPRLIERLNAGIWQNGGFARKLTLISAPAGFGKTTLISEWVANLRLGALGQATATDGVASPIAIAWLSLDESDNDLTRFLTYLIGALQTIEVDVGKGVLSALQSPQPPPAETILTALINEIVALSCRIVLILDDYHLIDTQPIHDALVFLLRRLPPPMHVVIATREDPPLSLARLRARGQLTELRGADLRFSSSEAAEFLNRVMGLDLSAEDIAALENRTEGWVAGLQLAAISMQGRKDVTGFIQSFTGSHHFVLDYLVEEVLRQQPDSVQEFLLQTAILDRLSGSLCDALTGQNTGRATLEMLEHANLFVVFLDEERHWYRYHHLFADLLRRQLRQIQPERVPTLHQRAIEWYEVHGFTDEAIEHALRVQDLGRATRLIEGVAEAMWGRDGHNTLRRWLAKLPTELVFAKPHLCVFHAGYLFASGQQDAAERDLQAAEQVLDSASDCATKSSLAKQDQLACVGRVKLLGRIAATRASMASYRSDASGVFPHARQALEYLPEQDVFWRGSAAIALADAHSIEGDIAAAYRAYLEASGAIKALGNLYLLMNVNVRLAVNLRSQGRLKRVIEICQQQLESANVQGMSQMDVVGWASAILGEALAEVGDLDGAIDQAKRGVELAERGRDVVMLIWSYMCLTRVLFSRGDLAAAKEITVKAENIAQESIVPLWITNLMAAWQVRVWLEQDRLEAASQWMEERGLNADGELAYLRENEYLALIRIFIAQGRLDEAISLLQRLFEAAETREHASRMIEVLSLQSLALQTQGDTDRAIATLERALTLAEPGGFIRIFVDEGPLMARLLYEALSRGIAPDYVRRLLAAFPVTEPEQTDVSRILTSNSELIEPLSEREVEVLQLFAEGLTNREIASRLFLALNTVKAHAGNIYGKLNVHSRTQAIARAQALGLLPPK